MEITVHCKDDSYVISTEDIITARDLKLFIERKQDIDFRDQILVYNYNDLILYDGMALKDLQPNHGTMNVYTKLSPQMVKVSLLTQLSDDSSISLEIHSKNNVLQLKMLIGEKFGLSPHRQNLIMTGVKPMCDWDTLEEYMIDDEPCVDLSEIPIDVEQILDITIVKEDGFRHQVQVENSDTIYTLHGIARRDGLARGYGFHFRWNHQILSGKDVFAWLDIENDSEVVLVLDKEEES